MSRGNVLDHPQVEAGRFEAVLEVAANMRGWDRREIYGARWSDMPEDVAADSMAGPCWVVRHDCRPVAAIGVVAIRPGVFSPWCFGTDEFPRVARLLTRIGKEAIIPAVRDCGGHRLEVKSLDGHTDAQNWMVRCFGAELEATHPDYARKGGESLTYHTFVVRL